MGEPMFVPLGVMSMIGICDNLGRKKKGDLLGHPATVPSVVQMGVPTVVPMGVMSMIGDVVDVVELYCDNLGRKEGNLLGRLATEPIVQMYEAG